MIIKYDFFLTLVCDIKNFIDVTKLNFEFFINNFFYIQPTPPIQNIIHATYIWI